MKMRAAIFGLGLLVATNANAQVLLNYSFDFGGSSLLVPDHNVAGVSDTHGIFSDLAQILHVDVWFEAEGGYNGDLYVTLQHGNNMSVLLNRPGRDTTSHLGYDDSGFTVTFRDSAGNGDIHTYRTTLPPAEGQPLTGIWQPDGRAVDPNISLTSSQRTALLSNFVGQNINGDWTLFAADLSSGGETTILSWGMTVTVVPEPAPTRITVVALLAAFWIFKKRADGEG